MFTVRSYVHFLCRCFFRGIFWLRYFQIGNFLNIFIWTIDGTLTSTATPVRVDQGVLAVTGHSTLLRSLEIELYHQMLFRVIPRTPPFWGGFYFSVEDTVSVFILSSTDRCSIFYCSNSKTSRIKDIFLDEALPFCIIMIRIFLVAVVLNHNTAKTTHWNEIFDRAF